MNAAEMPADVEPPVKTVTSSLESPPPSANDDLDPVVELPPPTGMVRVDHRRPLPLNLPTHREVLEAIAGDVNLHADLLPLHQRIVALYPPHLLDAVRTQLAGSEDPLAMAASNAWRVLVTAGLLEEALGVDQPALQVLVDEGADAREKVLAAVLFSLEGSERSEPLAEALAVAIEQLAERVRFKGTARATRRPGSQRVHRQPRAMREWFLRGVFVATFVLTGALHLVEFMVAAADAPAWVVVGDVGRGHAVLAPSRIDADEASLLAARETLRAQGLQTTLSPSGEWVVTRLPEEK